MIPSGKFEHFNNLDWFHSSPKNARNVRCFHVHYTLKKLVNDSLHNHYCTNMNQLYIFTVHYTILLYPYCTNDILLYIIAL
jgi:hypothetical protein